MGRRCSKKSFSKDFGLPSTKNSTWEPNLEWRVLLLLWPNCFWKSAVCQLCANTHSMFRVPDLFWLTGAVFRNISVTHSKFSKRKKSSKTWDFGPARRNGNFSDTPGDFQKVILSFSPSIYIYIYTYACTICTYIQYIYIHIHVNNLYIYTQNIYIYINYILYTIYYINTTNNI